MRFVLVWIKLVNMLQSEEVRRLQEQVDRLAAENAALRGSPLTGSKAEAMLAFEYDRIPTVLKTPRAIRIQRRVATAVLFVVPVIVIVVAVVGGIDAYRDHQQSAAISDGLKRLDAEFQK